MIFKRYFKQYSLQLIIYIYIYSCIVLIKITIIVFNGLGLLSSDVSNLTKARHIHSYEAPRGRRYRPPLAKDGV